MWGEAKQNLYSREEGAWNYIFDPQGHLARETVQMGERQYLYDAANRQIRILAGGKEIQKNQYGVETEQYYLQARYYNPVIGQYMDPFNILW